MFVFVCVCVYGGGGGGGGGGGPEPPFWGQILYISYMKCKRGEQCNLNLFVKSHV